MSLIRKSQAFFMQACFDMQMDDVSDHRRPRWS